MIVKLNGMLIKSNKLRINLKCNKYCLSCYYYVTPSVDRGWKHIGLPLFAQCVCLRVQQFLLCRRRPLQQTREISPVLAYRVAFGATLNVAQGHRRRASINPALIRSIMPVYDAQAHQCLGNVSCISLMPNEIPVFLILDMHSKIRNQEFRLYISLNW